ncbi:DUF1127 domain-containing protein [Alphaproteobacteria bacterium GH1-50]|uniref:DUF1127 domain-containing protein n=2 Tax=Kangsaoukella pontilimi TaxID=2691042 RepID=A0A7C9MDI3_9RHOB|nr:DUF1127 domain-containing protein [Kangsaoukella pontilimi]
MTVNTCNTALPAPLRRRRTGVLHMIEAMIALYRQRVALAKLDARMLDDIGVSASEARVESRRAPWDPPSYWHL